MNANKEARELPITWAAIHLLKITLQDSLTFRNNSPVARLAAYDDT